MVPIGCAPALVETFFQVIREVQNQTQAVESVPVSARLHLYLLSLGLPGSDPGKKLDHDKVGQPEIDKREMHAAPRTIKEGPS